MDPWCGLELHRKICHFLDCNLNCLLLILMVALTKHLFLVFHYLYNWNSNEPFFYGTKENVYIAMGSHQVLEELGCQEMGWGLYYTLIYWTGLSRNQGYISRWFILQNKRKCQRELKELALHLMASKIGTCFVGDWILLVDFSVIFSTGATTFGTSSLLSHVPGPLEKGLLSKRRICSYWAIFLLLK